MHPGSDHGHLKAMVDIRKVHEDFNQRGIDFLNIDADTALTMAQIASAADKNSEKRARNQRNARRAYETILHFGERTTFTSEQADKLDHKLRLLKAALEQLGEVL
jgi:hypothetical protein